MSDQPDPVESLSVYIPMDRRQALATGESLPFHTTGSALFADISGFTALTEALAQELGARRGAEELTLHLNQVYDALITELHRYRGSVIGFSGDAITCWLDGDDGRRAAACGVAMQAAMDQFAVVKTGMGRDISLSMKTAVAVGPVRRFLVGDKELLVVDAMAGTTLDRLAAGEHLAGKKEIVLDPAAAAALADGLEVTAWRVEPETGDRYAVLADLKLDVPADPWPPVPASALPLDKARPWLLHPVYSRLQSGQGEFLAELRPAVALFFRFGGIDYDVDDTAAFKLDEFMVLVAEILERYEASLIQLTIGDKGSYFYAAFGAPVAHEDDAVRAAAAALDLRALAIRLPYIEDIQIGITQGRMRTGAYGSATRRTYGVLGDAVNLAARLMQAARPGQILVEAEVRRAAGDAFGWESLPPLQVKGKTQIAAVFGLERRRERKAFRLQEPSYSLPMVGRQAELDLVRARLDQVEAGKGQIIGITAEAGMGKSRLAAEIISLGIERGLEVLGGEAQSYGTRTSYLVWQSVWRAFFEIELDWELAATIAALDDFLGAIDPALVPRYPLLGPVLNLEFPDNDLTRGLDAKLRKSSLEALLADSLRGRVREGPLLILLEDCHWLDPLSQELLEVIARTAVNLPVLIVLTYRPPDEVHFKGVGLDQLSHFTEFSLADFTPAEARTLIQLKLEQIFGSLTSAPQALVTLITEKAAGNPFYVEELLNYLKDRQIDPADRSALAQVDLPTSLHSLILSRIDQLTESQKIALKVASVIGRLFQAVMIWGVYPELGDSDRVRADLDQLSRMEITSLDTPEPELTYLFKHIITQQVAYENLPFATRARLHEQIGIYLENKTTNGTGKLVDLLAYHFGQTQNEDKQREYFLKAGESAQADYANLAAIEYYRRLLPLLAETEQVEVQLKLGAVLELVGEWDEAGEQYQAAFALADKLGDDLSRGECQHAVGRLMMKQGQYVGALQWLEQSQGVFRALNNRVGVGRVLHTEGTLAAQQGNYDGARTLYQESLAIRRELADKKNIASLLNNLAIVARFKGDSDQARSLHEEALATRRELGDRLEIAHSLNNLGNVLLDQGDFFAARACLEEALTLRREVGDRWAIANALNNLGNVVRSQGDFAAARALYEESLTINADLGDRRALAYVLEDMSCLAGAEGQFERVLRLAAAAAGIRDSIGSPLSPAEVKQLEGTLVTARGALSAEAQAAANTSGRALSLEEALAYALGKN